MTAYQIETHDPSTGLPIAKYKEFSGAAIEDILGEVDLAQQEWAELSMEVRADHLRAIARELGQQRIPLAEQIVAEMGKPVSEALGEIDKCAWVFNYYADEGPAFLKSEKVETGAQESWVAHEAMGIILAIMPWNFPWWQAARFAAPALLAGNAGLLKHAPNVTGCALAIEKLFLRAGLPSNVFRTLVVAEQNVPAVTERLISDKRIAAVTLTGSERAGMAVAARAGREIKKTVLELGGSDPFVVLEDADMELVVASAIKSRFLNCGQSCLAAKRFIVHEALIEEFLSRFTRAVEGMIVGEPSNPTTDIGPLAREDMVVELERQIETSIAAGASVLTGGHRLDRAGAWFAPTILANVSLDMAVMTEETFGPLAAVISVSSDAEALTVANATRFGLGASVWSADTDRALAVGRGITSGAIFINAVVASDPRLPFGGTKRSGIGRELGAAGALEFTNTRTYYVGANSESTKVSGRV